jgi:hypothetical protein
LGGGGRDGVEGKDVCRELKVRIEGERRKLGDNGEASRERT